MAACDSSLRGKRHEAQINPEVSDDDGPGDLTAAERDALRASCDRWLQGHGLRRSRISFASSSPAAG